MKTRVIHVHAGEWAGLEILILLLSIINVSCAEGGFGRSIA